RPGAALPGPGGGARRRAAGGREGRQDRAAARPLGRDYPANPEVIRYGAKPARRWREAMQVGAAMFFTDYSMGAGELAQALEARGFESVWAPEHSHVPLSRKSPFPSGGELPKQYGEVM